MMKVSHSRKQVKVDFLDSSPPSDKSPLAPWRSPLAHALHRNRSLPNSRYAQLATVRSNGFPANRTLVVRGFLPGSNQLRFVTDRRSEKIEQSDRAELCWYFPKTREQFRITGQLHLVDRNCSDQKRLKARQIIWHELSDSGRLSFLWPAPGQPRSAPEAFQIDPPDDRQPVDHFCLLLLEPMSVDHLELRGEPQTRTLYELNHDLISKDSTMQTDPWQISNINP